MFERFKEKLAELYHLKSAMAVLHWDKEVYMPREGNASRAATIAYLAGELHTKFLSPEFKSLLASIREDMLAGKLSSEESAVVREVCREFVREEKLPLEFVTESARITSEAHHVWAEARKKSDFTMFLPHLKQIVDLKRQEADLVGFQNSPYDALLDIYEPYANSQEIKIVLEELQDFLVPFLRRIQNSPVHIDPEILKGDFDIEKQKALGRTFAEKMGFDFSAGRVDASNHPFTTSSHPSDVRITTRFDANNLFYSLGSTIHETGHALYEQGLPAENFGTPLGESVSLGIHESQSRIWENNIGKSRPFWTYFYPILQKEFPHVFSAVSFEDFYRALNHVQPSLIRTEADEVTYNLHIVLRFEIEKNLLEGTISVEDLPKIWNERVKEMLGVDVPDDSVGVLQDVHWAEGLFGYFPTYALGNLYAAQFYAAAKRDVLNLEEEIAHGEFAHVRTWLRKNIHMHGKFYSANELVKNATGEPLTSKYFIEYLTNKYTEIYKL